MADLDVEWKFFLVVSATMERLGELTQARERQLQVVHNRAGGCTFSIPANDDLFWDAEPVKHGVLAVRNDNPVWSGMIWTNDDQLPGNRVGVSCVGWFETLNRRILRQDVTYPRFTTPTSDITGGGIIFMDPYGAEGDTDYHPGGLLTIANAQRDTWVSAGTNTDTMNRIISYTRGQSIGEAITSLSDVEAGFDFSIDPVSRAMNIQNWDQYPDLRESVIFGYDWGPNNMQSLGRQQDASEMNNRGTAFGSYGGGMAEDLEAQAEYQLFEAEYQLSEVVDPNILLAYSGGEVALRARPRTIYTPTPFPFIEGRVPEPFVDYGLGSQVGLSADSHRVQIDKASVRIFGMNITITNEGNEKLAALQVIPGG